MKGFCRLWPRRDILLTESRRDRRSKQNVLQYLMEQFQEQLSRHGMIHDILLRSEQSLVEDEESREVTISFSKSEEEGEPAASIHLFLLPDEESCEVEVEIAYPGVSDAEQASRLWKQAREIVREASLTEKRRYLEPGKLGEATILLDYHFLLDQPATEEDAEELRQTMERFAADLGKLVRLQV